jgi:pimeloyl-ACP methyl ester carboxylesterase
MKLERENQTMALADRRKLGYAEYGPAGGSAVFYLTGGNSSRNEGKWFEEAAGENHVRLIVPDRPGFGLSTFQPERQLLDWADDVAALADELSIESFSTFGLSGGGLHVLATAYRIPERIKKMAVVSGTAPPEMPGKSRGTGPPVRLIFLTAKRFPAINRVLLGQMASFYSDVDQMRKRMVQAMPAPDVELMQRRPEIIQIFADAAKEAHRHGIDGDAWEWHLYVHPWGFQMGEIKSEVKLWYGIHDKQVPIGMGRYLAQELPGATPIKVEDGGHFSTINNYIGEIFDYLA